MFYPPQFSLDKTLNEQAQYKYWYDNEFSPFIKYIFKRYFSSCRNANLYSVYMQLETLTMQGKGIAIICGTHILLFPLPR